MDLNKFDLVANSEAGADLTIINPKDDQPTDIVFTFKGPRSVGFEDALKKATDKASSVLFLAEYCLGWKNVEINGKTVQFSRENVVNVLTKYDILYGQCVEFVVDMRNFIKD